MVLRDRPTRPHRPRLSLARSAQPRRHPHHRLDPHPARRRPYRRLPCQDISNAGRRAGTGPHSSLWQHITSPLRLLRPPVVFVENVAALRRRGLDVVHTDLATLGYDTSWLCLRASAIGAPHQPDRLFLVAIHHRGESERCPRPAPVTAKASATHTACPTSSDPATISFSHPAPPAPAHQAAARAGRQARPLASERESEHVVP
ncbi:DNA cytosine methyltransferase [Micromonospora sp. CPCC 205543]